MATGEPSIKNALSGESLSKQNQQRTMRHIYRPLMTVFSGVGVSVWHTDKRVMCVKIMYFMLANAAVLTTQVICIYDLINVQNEHVWRIKVYRISHCDYKLFFCMRHA
jgi:hypothetical protein